VWRRHRAPQIAAAGLAGGDGVEVETNATAPKYMTAYEAIHYLADNSKWGNEVRCGPSEQVRHDKFGMINVGKMPLLGAQTEFKRVAEHGFIHAIGRLEGRGQHVPIPEPYWLSATLNPFSLENRDISETMPAVRNPDGIPSYKNVKILRSEVERLWPRRRDA
jgi:hypothetical protein